MIATPTIRALTRTFFARFFESDLTSGADDLRASIFYLLAFLAAPGIAAPFFVGLGSSYKTPGVAGWGWSLTASQLGPEALRLASLNDKALYLSLSLVVSGVISAIAWNSLLPDRRDALVLGSLPVRGRTIVAARLSALVGFITLIAVAMHTLASLSFAIFLSPGSGVVFFLRNVAAHFVSACAASVFVLFATTALQGVALAIAGPRWFVRVSPILQGLLAAAAVAGLCFVPALVQMTRPTFQPGAGEATWLLRLAPPFWFLGIYETILGTTNPVAVRFAATAWIALGAAVSLTFLTYPLAYRRVMQSAVADVDRGASSGAGIEWLSRALASDLAVRAVVRFVLTTFARVERRRFVLATALGAGFAWAAPGWLTFLHAPHGPPSALELSAPFSILLFGLVGLRLAAALPADLRASWIFDAALVPWRTARLGLERVLIALGVVPIAGASSLVYWRLWRGAAALTHLGLILTTGVILTEALVWRLRGVPCASPWTPRSGRLRARWPLYAAALILVTSVLPAQERVLFSHPAVALLLVVLYTAVAWLVRRAASRRGSVEDDVAPSILAPGGPFAPAAATRPRATFNDWRTDIVWRHELSYLRRDLVLASRTLSRRLGFSILAIATIAFGVGATVAVYAIAYATLLKPIDIPDLNRVVNLYNYWPSASQPLVTFSWPDYQVLRDQQRSYEAMTAWAIHDDALSAHGVAVPLIAEAVDGAYFSFVGATMRLGRPIVASDDRPGAPLTIVLSETAWRRDLDADPDIVGKILTYGGQRADVIGVAAARVRGVFMPNVRPTDAWIPLAALRDGGAFAGAIGDNDRDRHAVYVKGRLRPGVTRDAATAELDTIAHRLDAAFPLDRDPRVRRHWELRAAADVHLHETTTAFALPLAVVLMIAVGLVLLVTCTNLANLTLARGVAIRGAIAVRLALGASRRRLIEQQIVEAALVAAVGCAVAAVLARALVAAARQSSLALAPGLTMQIDPTLTTGAWVVFGASMLVVIAVCGAWPAWRLTTVSLRTTLSSAGSGGDAGGWRGRQGIIASQVAVSVLLLGAAAAFLGDLAARARPVSDMALDRVAAVTLRPSDTRRGTRTLLETLTAIAARARREPGVDSVALASQLPFEGSAASWIARGSETPLPVDTVLASSTIFDTLRVRLLAGRTLDDRQDSDEIVIGASAARALFGGTAAVGRTLVIRSTSTDASGMSVRIAGVAEDVPSRVPARFFAGVIYRPLTSDAYRVSVLARAADSASAPVSVLPAIVHRIDPDLLVVESTTAAIAAGIDNPTARVAARLAAVLGAATLLMAMTGLYGVLSQRVADRRRELGIRGALGAARADIIRLIIVDGLRPVAMGFGVGVLAGVFVQLALQPFLTRLMPSATWTVLLPIPPLLIVAALAASYFPARRALAVDPATAIRDV